MFIMTVFFDYFEIIPDMPIWFYLLWIIVVLIEIIVKQSQRN